MKNERTKKHGSEKKRKKNKEELVAGNSYFPGDK